MSRLQTNLRTPNRFDAEAIKKYALRDQGILVVNIDDHRLTWDQKEILKQIARKIGFGDCLAKA